MKTFFIFLLLSILTTVKAKYPKKILNGKELDSTLKTPWVVAVEIQETETLKVYCVGNLISSRHVLSSGHCFVDNADIADGQWYWLPFNKTWDGKEGCDGKDLIVPDDIRDAYTFKFNTVFRHCDNDNTIVRKAKKIILPGMCYGKSPENWFQKFDFAIVELIEEVPLSDTVSPAKVSFEPISYLGKQITVAGYGYDPSTHSVRGKLKYFVSNEIVNCNNFEEHTLPTDDWLCFKSPEQMFCGSDSGAGGVLTEGGKYQIVGIMSRSDPCISGNDMSGYMVPVKKHLADICKYTEICA